MKLVAYYPKGILAPIELLAVMVPVGVVTHNIWIDALSDRISDMVDLESNPQEAAEQACRALDCPHCSDPDQLGQYIVEDNWNFQTWINNSFIGKGDPFSDYAAEDDLEALEAIKKTDLEKWVNHAEYLMTGNALERYMGVYFSEEKIEELSPTSNIDTKKEVFCPKGIEIPKIIKVVKLPLGIVTFDDWVNGISEKVQEMLLLERNPRRVVNQICNLFNIPPCEELEQFGNYVVNSDTKFKSYIKRFEEYFPIVFSEKNIDPDDEDYYKVHIKHWVDMASKLDMSQLMNLEFESPDIFPSEDLKPYLDFIEDNLYFWSEFRDDENSCDLYSYFYHFSLGLTIRDGMVVLSALIEGQKEVLFENIEEFHLNIRRFNGGHIPTLSYHHDIYKKWFFSKPNYKIHYFTLEQKWNIESSTAEVVGFISTYFSGLLNLFENKHFNFSLPKATENEAQDKDFIQHLRLLLMVLIDNYSKLQKELEAELRFLDKNF
jgi:hypothetical protein